ncbi:MAG: hypothetical protein ACI8W9_001171, partial [Psychromonas sp.]
NRQVFSAGDCAFLSPTWRRRISEPYSPLIKKSGLNLDQMNNSITCRNRQGFSAGDCAFLSLTKCSKGSKKYGRVGW